MNHAAQLGPLRTCPSVSSFNYAQETRPVAQTRFMLAGNCVDTSVPLVAQAQHGVLRSASSRVQASINCAAASFGATVAALGVGMQRLFVVYRDFLAGFDIAARKEQDVAVQIFHVGVWFAAVIDVMSSVTAAAPVEAETAVDVADAQHGPPPRAAHRLPIGDALARVFGNLSAAGKQLRGKTAFAVDWRFSDG